MTDQPATSAATPCPDCRGSGVMGGPTPALPLGREPSAWTTCSGCRGYGIVQGLNDIRTCPDCHGDCYERRRDERGGFTRA